MEAARLANLPRDRRSSTEKNPLPTESRPHMAEAFEKIF
jgi:hypothetical protein